MVKVLSSLFIFINIFIFAQNQLSINGTISNLNKEQTLDIHLYDEKNNLVKSTFVEDRKFQFSELKSGVYYFQIGNGEFSQREKPFSLDKNSIVEIKYSIQNIDEVILQGKKSELKFENGNITYEITDTPLAKLPTSTDLLSKLPYLTIDPNGENITFLGKGTPLLYIDQQRVDFTTFSSVSVDDIKSIELIKNPSIKYEAEGKSVLKINLKKSRKDGQKITLTETTQFQKKFNNLFSAQIQLKKNKTEWKFNGSYNQINHWESNGFDYSVPHQNIESNYRIISITKRPQTIFGGSFYRELNDNGDYLSIGFNSNFRPDKGDNNTETDYSENGIFKHIKTLNQQDRKRATINSTFNYFKNFKTWDATLFTGFQYKRESNVVDYNFYNNENQTEYIFNQYRNQKYYGDVFSGRFDFTKKLNENINGELGGSYTTAETKTDNYTNYASTSNKEFFKYNFKEHNFAGYFNINYTKEKWTAKMGLRAETTNAKGFNITENHQPINRNYLDWFPNAEITLEADEKHSYSINYRKSISRPNYGDLSSGGLYGSPYVEYQGNPNLIPTYTHTLTLTGSLNKIGLNANFYHSKNPMGYTLVFNENNAISQFTIVNFEKDLGLSFSVDYPFEIKKWSSQNSFSLNYDKTEDFKAVLQKSTPYIYLYTNNTIKISPYFNFLLDGSFISKRVEGLYENNAVGLLNLGISSHYQNFDFTLRYNDVFNQMNYVQKMSYAKMISKGTFYGNTPTISFSIKYNFGNIKKSNYKQTEVNENSNRL